MNVFTVQAVSVAIVRPMQTVPSMKVVAEGNAHPTTAWVLHVLTTLTVNFSLKDAVTELANTQMKNAMNHLVLANLQPLLFVQ